MKRRILLLASTLGVLIAGSGIATAQADPADYFAALNNQGVTVWDYPLMMHHGLLACSMLYDNVNPYPILIMSGYDSPTASIIIGTAQQTLCPGNAVTGPPDYFSDSAVY